jgi:hypothetical protein
MDEVPAHWRAYEAASRLAATTSEQSHSTRTLTSGWVVAGFAGLGYLASAERIVLAATIPSEVARPLMMATVALFAAIGVSVNGMIDAHVFRRAWRTALADLVFLEMRHHDLPPMFCNLRLSASSVYRRLLAWFALAPAVMFFVIAGVAAAVALRNAGAAVPWQAAVTAAAAALGIADATIFMALERDLPAGPTRDQVIAMRPDVGWSTVGRPSAASAQV